MAFNGKWKSSGNENGPAILLHMGMPKEVVGAFKDVETIVEFNQIDEKTTNEVRTVGKKVTKTVFKIGETCQISAWNEDILDVVPTLIGPNKVKVEFDHLGVHVANVRELISDAQFEDRVDLDHGKVVGKFIYTRC